MTHRVVVYDPITYSLLESGILLPIIAAAVAFIAAFVLYDKVTRRLLFRLRNHPANRKARWKVTAVEYGGWAIAGGLALLAFNHFYI